MKRITTSLIFLVFAGHFIVAAASGEPEGSGDPGNASEAASAGGVITGIVTEEGTMEPMEYSTVALYSREDSTLIGGTVTGPDGKFELEKVPFGEYYIITDFVGYNKSVESLKVSRDNRRIDLGVMELSMDAQAIEEVEIVGDRKRVSYRIDKKVVAVSQDLNAAGGSAVDVLENTPSVTVDIEGNVSLRGSGSFTVLINGKPSVLSGSDALRQIPASSIENIEIITNPSAKYDPDGNAGIINVVLKKSAESGTTGIVNASVGTNNKYRADFLLNRKMDRWEIFLGGNYSDNLYAGDLTRNQVTFGDTADNFLDAEGVFNFMRSGTRLRTGFSYDFTPRSSLTFEVSGGVDGFGIDRSNRTHEYSMPASDDIYYVSSSVMDRGGEYIQFNATYTQQFDSKDHKLVFMADYSRENDKGVDSQDDYNTGPDYEIEDVVADRTRGIEIAGENEYRFQADYTRPFAGGARLEAGYQVRIDQETEDFTFEEYDPAGEIWEVNPVYTNRVDFFRGIQGVYATFGGEINEFQYQLGMRGEHTYRNLSHDLADDAYLINRLDYYPTVHFARQFNNDHQVMLSYSKRVDRPRGYYLEPNVSYVDPYTIRVGNPGLQPEYIHSFELGYQKGWGMNFLAVELYYRNTQNLMTRVTEYNDSLDLFVMTRENLNSDNAAGAEVMVNWKFGNWLTLNGSVSPYYYALDGEISGNPVSESSFNWRSNLNATFQITPTTRFQTNMSYRSRSVNAQGYSKGFYYMNMAFRQDFFKRKLSATLQLRDVFGTMRYESYSFGENFEQKMIRTREARVFTVTLSYRINNYRFDPDRANRGGGGGGMDMF